MNEKQTRLNDTNQEKGVSNWLTVLPLAQNGFTLNKEQFWDSIRIRYGWEIKNLPTTCVRGSKFTIDHSMSCKKGGFVTLRHNNIRDITAKILGEVCKDVAIEPVFLPLTGEKMQKKSAKIGDEVGLDVRALGFWVRGQQAFIDVMVFDPNACIYLKISLQQCYTMNEKEKNRQYNERIMETDHGTFAPLVFSINGGTGRECRTFYSRLAELIAEKINISKSIVVSSIRTKLRFTLLRASLICLRGSRSVTRQV